VETEWGCSVRERWRREESCVGDDLERGMRGTWEEGEGSIRDGAMAVEIGDIKL